MQQKAIIYCRVSSEKQRTEGHGLDSQEHRCREYAQRRGYEVIKVFRDSFTGAGDFMERPEMAKLLGFLDNNPVINYVVIFDDLKRLARDTIMYLKLRREFDARKARVECPNFTFEDTPEGSFIETILAAQGELERKQNQRQVIQKMKARLENGYWCFVTPDGYKRVKDAIHGAIIKPKEGEAEIIREALEGFASGRFGNQVEVQKFLLDKKLGGRNKISLFLVKKILTNPVYAGFIEYKPWGVSLRTGHHQRIIDPLVFQQIQDILNGKVRVKFRKDNTKEFPLRNFVLCFCCGKPMTASWTTGRNGKHPYYHCKTKGCSIKGKAIRRKDIESQFEEILKSIKPKEATLNLTKEILLDIWGKKLGQLSDVRKDNERNLDEIRAKIRMFLDRIGKTENETVVKTYEKEVEKLSNEEQILETQGQVMRGSNPDFGTALETAFGFIKNPYVYWRKNDLASKHLVLKLVFTDKITYERGVGFGTAKLALPLRVFEMSEQSNSNLVTLRGVEPRFSP